jgi:hypothetical protein
MVTKGRVTMYIESRANGAYYLRESHWNPQTQKPVSKAAYLGKNAREARDKLATLTQDETLLSELSHIYDCDEFLRKIIKIIDSHQKSCDYTNIQKTLQKCIIDLERFWMIGRRSDKTHQECLFCRYYRADFCKYFNQQLTDIEIFRPCRALQTRSKK